MPGLSQEDTLFLQQAKAKYINALSLVVQKFSPHLNVIGAMSRMSKLIMLISVAEVQFLIQKRIIVLVLREWLKKKITA